MKTIFGEENFIDKEMIDIYKLYDEQLTDGVYACATKMGIQIDKRKFEHWLKFCAELEQIDKSELIDIAIKRKFDEKDYRIAVLERALSNVFRRAYFAELEELDDGMHIMTEKEYVEMHKKWAIDQAEKELKEQK